MPDAAAAPAAERRGRRAAIARAVIAGYVDAFTLLRLRVFTSFMSGNTTSTGMRASQGRVGEALHDLTPIPCFVLGAFVGTLLQGGRQTQTGIRTPLVGATLLVAGMGCLLGGAPDTFAVVVLATAMGLLSTQTARVGAQALNSGYVTGDLKSLGQHLASAVLQRPVEDRQGEGDTHLRRAALLLAVWGALLVGGLVGAGAATRLGAWALLVPAGGLVAVALAEARTGRSSR